MHCIAQFLARESPQRARAHGSFHNVLFYLISLLLHRMASAHAPPIASILLRCSICPKRPKFSDISHLLTHVASKGHLAQQFKTTVRASTDPAAREALRLYNEWYQKYGIEQLCANRLRTNESKKRAKARGRLGTAPPAETPGASTQASSEAERPRCSADDSAHVDRLPTRHARREDPLFTPVDLPLLYAPHHRPHVPRMHLWSTEPARVHDAPKLVSVPPAYAPWLYPSGEDGHSDLTPDGMAYGHDSGLGYSLGSPEPDRSSALAEVDHSDLTSKEAEKLEGEAQLKGVFWPGMNIFDSAPPELRRRRNQRKDGSVVAQMQLNSALVEPTELVFWAGGDLKKERRIYSPADQSPGEVDPSAKRRRSSRAFTAALSESSVNVPRALRTTRAGKTTTKGLDRSRPPPRAGSIPTERPGGSQVHSSPPKQVSRHRPVSASSVPEPEMGYNAVGDPEGRKRPFTVYKDDGVADIEHDHPPPDFLPSQGSEDVGGPESLAPSISGRSKTSSITADDLDADPFQRQITSFFKPVVPGRSGKENHELGMEYYDAVDKVPYRPHSEGGTETYLSDEDHCTSRLLDSLPLVDLEALRGPPTFGYSANPLSAGMPPMHGHGLSPVCRTTSAAGFHPIPHRDGSFRTPSLGRSLKPEVGPHFDSELLFHGLRG